MARETFEGYVMDVACIRKNRRDGLAEAAEAHTRGCALMGHCIESGYGLVDEDGRIMLLDAQATPEVMALVRASDREHGIRIRVEREEEDGEMRTRTVEPVDPA